MTNPNECTIEPNKNTSSLPYPTTPAGDPDLGCVYEDVMFLQRTLTTIRNHDTTTPLFLFHASHLFISAR